ncbi:MAG: hypothetical protein FWG52_09840 [Proteobacteria bacterium]|jgi:hypothetical protein|nr:hypothetical protein [Pseudomonadota bacterium]
MGAMADVVRIHVPSLHSCGIPPSNARVFDAVFLAKIAAANRLYRKMRNWGIAIDYLHIPNSQEDALPMLRIKLGHKCSLKPFLDATKGMRQYFPASRAVPGRMVAVLDDCFLMLELPT